MQNYSSRIHLNWSVRTNGCVMPANSFIIVHSEHVISEIFAETKFLLIRFFLQFFSFNKFDIHNISPPAFLECIFTFLHSAGASLLRQHMLSIKLHFSPVNRKSIAFYDFFC